MDERCLSWLYGHIATIKYMCKHSWLTDTQGQVEPKGLEQRFSGQRTSLGTCQPEYNSELRLASDASDILHLRLARLCERSCTYVELLLHRTLPTVLIGGAVLFNNAKYQTSTYIWTSSGSLPISNPYLSMWWSMACHLALDWQMAVNYLEPKALHWQRFTSKITQGSCSVSPQKVNIHVG